LIFLYKEKKIVDFDDEIQITFPEIEELLIKIQEEVDYYIL